MPLIVAVLSCTSLPNCKFKLLEAHSLHSAAQTRTIIIPSTASTKLTFSSFFFSFFFFPSVVLITGSSTSNPPSPAKMSNRGERAQTELRRSRSSAGCLWSGFFRPAAGLAWTCPTSGLTLWWRRAGQSRRYRLRRLAMLRSRLRVSLGRPRAGCPT